jgi:hypothetical protein
MQETTAQAHHTVPSTVQMTSPGLVKLYNNSEFSDVLVKCGELAIKAHTLVLCAHSDTFRAAFNNKDGRAVIISFKRVAVYKKYPYTFLLYHLIRKTYLFDSMFHFHLPRTHIA